MAGSYAMLRGKNAEFQMDLIENMGDAHEALEECYDMIEYLSKQGPERLTLAYHYHLRKRTTHHAKECHFCKDLMKGREEQDS